MAKKAERRRKTEHREISKDGFPSVFGSRFTSSEDFQGDSGTQTDDSFRTSARRQHSTMAGLRRDWQTDGGWQNDPRWRTFRIAATEEQKRRIDTRREKAVSLGWLADLPDHRDYNAATIKPLGKKKVGLMAQKSKLPSVINNWRYCSPIEDQETLGSCTAQAAVGLMEYEMRRNGVEHVDGSRLFVYKTTRRLMGWTGDTGAHLRTTMKAISAFGVPPEAYWPYDITRFEDEPSAFLYAYGQNYKAMEYARLDPRGQDPEDTLVNVKRTLAAGFSVIFGFTVFSTMSDAPDIEFPDPNEPIAATGGHAVMAIGYNDDHEATLVDRKTGDLIRKREPSLIVRNSWGTGWGLNGYGFLPYRYITDALAVDFWTAYSTQWIDEGQFA